MNDIFRMLKASEVMRERCLVKETEKISKEQFRREQISDAEDRTKMEADAESVEEETRSAYFEINGEESVIE